MKKAKWLIAASLVVILTILLPAVADTRYPFVLVSLRNIYNYPQGRMCWSNEYICATSTNNVNGDYVLNWRQWPPPSIYHPNPPYRYVYATNDTNYHSVKDGQSYDGLQIVLDINPYSWGYSPTAVIYITSYNPNNCSENYCVYFSASVNDDYPAECARKLINSSNDCSCETDTGMGVLDVWNAGWAGTATFRAFHLLPFFYPRDWRHLICNGLQIRPKPTIPDGSIYMAYIDEWTRTPEEFEALSRYVDRWLDSVCTGADLNDDGIVNFVDFATDPNAFECIAVMWLDGTL